MDKPNVLHNDSGWIFPFLPFLECTEFSCRYLVTQVFVPISKDFAIELMMTDVGGNKRRVVLSTSVREISATPLHAKLPLSLIKRDSWVNLCFDLVSILSDAFPGQTFNNLDISPSAVKKFVIIKFIFVSRCCVLK